MNYCDAGTGITNESIAYFRSVRPRLSDINEVSIRFPGFTDPFDPYLMVLRDTAGNEIRLSGCTTGYNGEGPRWTAQILREEGFPSADVGRALTDGELDLRR